MQHRHTDNTDLNLLFRARQRLTVSEIDKLVVGAATGEHSTAAIYRVGSRADGTSRRDSDYDYMILLDEGTHYDSSNTVGFQVTSDQWCEKVTFTRRDLEYPDQMEGKETKLIFLYGKYRERVLLWGDNVFDKWLSPHIAEIFEANGINDESVKARNALMKNAGDAFL